MAGSGLVADIPPGPEENARAFQPQGTPSSYGSGGAGGAAESYVVQI